MLSKEPLLKSNDLVTIQEDDFNIGKKEIGWSSRQPKFGRTIKVLLKKELITKVRHIPTIIEFLSACLITVFLYPVYKLARKTIPGSANPPYLGEVNITETVMMFLGYNQSRLVGVPDCPNTQNFRKFWNEHISSNLTEFLIVNTTNEMRDRIYERDTNAIGFHWANCFEENSTTSPEIHFYKQAVYGDPQEGFFSVFLNILHNGDYGMFFSPNLVPIDRQEFAQRTYDNLFSIHIAIGFFGVAPAILATMPTIQAVLEDKDSMVSVLIQLMGATETEVWLVQFIIFFLLSVPPYLIYGIQMCFLYAMVGTDFFLFLFVSFLFIIAHTLFLFVLLTFMQTRRAGRSLTVAFALFAIFFGYLHFFYTLNAQNTSMPLKHGMSIIPLSVYQLITMEFYVRRLDGYPGVKWSQVGDNSFDYPIWIGIMWLFIDIGFYGLLWLFFNAVLPRDYGTSLIHIRDFFKAETWRFLFSSQHARTDAMGDRIATCENSLKISGLTKKYKGSRTVAVDDVSFHLGRGEVIVMIGPNGAGKSTIINTIAGAIKRDHGRMVLFDQKETKQFREIQQYLGICFQNNILVDLLNVTEHFELFGAIRGLPDAYIQEAEEFYEETLQLSNSRKTRSCDLSGGQKRKLCLALALLGNPPIVIMDEPTAGVDVQARQLIWKTISNLQNSTCLITSHALEEAEAVSSRLFICAGGKIPFMGTSTELRKQFNCGYVLRVELANKEKMAEIVGLAERIVPGSKMVEDRDDCIQMPVDERDADFLEELENRKEEFGIVSYNYAVEQLEDTLLKMIETAEAAFQGQH